MDKRWWTVLLFALMAHDMPEPPKQAAVTSMECDGCGDVYHGDPYYAPSYCSRCGGRIIEIEHTVENPDYESWEQMKKLRAIFEDYRRANA